MSSTYKKLEMTVFLSELIGEATFNTVMLTKQDKFLRACLLLRWMKSKRNDGESISNK